MAWGAVRAGVGSAAGVRRTRRTARSQSKHPSAHTKRAARLRTIRLFGAEACVPPDRQRAGWRRGSEERRTRTDRLPFPRHAAVAVLQAARARDAADEAARRQAEEAARRQIPELPDMLRDDITDLRSEAMWAGPGTPPTTRSSPRGACLESARGEGTLAYAAL
jgi:hypothetical protein